MKVIVATGIEGIDGTVDVPDPAVDLVLMVDGTPVALVPAGHSIGGVPVWVADRHAEPSR